MSAATGGKVWTIPGDVPTQVGVSKHAIRKLQGKNIPITKLFFMGLLPIALLPTIAYILLYPMMKTSVPSIPENIADGYYSQGISMSFPIAITIAIYTLSIIIVCTLVMRYSNTIYHAGKTWAIIISTTMVGLFILPSTLLIPMPVQDNSVSFSTWAKEKYGFSEVERYDLSKTSIEATKPSGEKVKMNVFRQGEFIYLYQSSNELIELVHKLDEGKSE